MDSDQKDMLLVSGVLVTILVVLLTAMLISQYLSGGCIQ